MTEEMKAAMEEAATAALPAFEANGWTYGGSPPHQHIPSREDLLEALGEIVHHFKSDSDEGPASCGRFTMRREKRWTGDRFTISLDLADIPYPCPTNDKD